MKRAQSRKAKSPDHPKARRKPRDESRALVPLPTPHPKQKLQQDMTMAEMMGMIFGSLIGGFAFAGKKGMSGIGTIVGASIGLVAGKHYDKAMRAAQKKPKRRKVTDVEFVEQQPVKT